MRLYTGSGDDGSTGLFGGGRVSKSALRVEAYGAVDEANATLGLAGASLIEAVESATDPAARACLARIGSILSALQSRLFDLGADLATPPDSEHADKITRLGDADVATLEAWIDEVDGGNESMSSFVLPGGSEAAARLHLARTIARRAERRMVELAATEGVTAAAIVWANRLSDLLFAMARRVNKAIGVDDVPWVAGDHR